ncbi:hypothetical protein HPT27_04695 [Permianibacter sp. IMCC34836]|uniref:hypothetical protein n=1 Tax=Permianibacter fluminis TaxID=2738515 RepID=UPI001556A8E8|nr:hypothetical protein [Permianibacter fluminis]NQD36314.1 hypothetical protein [Permianibacter fluminis]
MNDTSRSFPENLARMHEHEERVRFASIEKILSKGDFCDHVDAIHDSLDHLFLLLQEDFPAGSEQHTLQLLAIRVFNSGASSLKLGLSGYFQAGFQLIRDMLEIVNLLDYFSLFPDKIVHWRSADATVIKNEYAPVVIRRALEQNQRFSNQRRDKPYRLLSEYANHPTYKGFLLVSPNNSPRLGPIEDEGLLNAFLEELAMHLVHCTLAASGMIECHDIDRLKAGLIYVDRLRAYYEKHIRGPSGARTS